MAVMFEDEIPRYPAPATYLPTFEDEPPMSPAPDFNELQERLMNAEDESSHWKKVARKRLDRIKALQTDSREHLCELSALKQELKINGEKHQKYKIKIKELQNSLFERQLDDIESKIRKRLRDEVKRKVRYPKLLVFIYITPNYFRFDIRIFGNIQALALNEF